MRLVLYISGPTARSGLAVQRARRLCSETLAGRAELEVVDTLENPQRAFEDCVHVTPTLALAGDVGSARAPRVFGDLDDPQAVLSALGLSPAGAGA